MTDKPTDNSPEPSQATGTSERQPSAEQIKLKRTLETLKKELDETYRGFSEISSELFDTASALETSEKRLRLAAEGAGIGLWDWDAESDKLALSPSWLRLVGVDKAPAEMGWSFWQEHIHPDDSNLVTQTLRKHLEGKIDEFQVEHRLKTAEGSWNWYLALGRISESEIGSSKRLAGILLDIHPRKQAEESARLSALRFESISTSATDGILSFDRKGRIIGWNPAMAELLDYSEEEALGKFAGMIVPEYLQDKSAKGINRIFRGGFNEYLGRVSEAKVVSKDGTVIPVEFSLAAWETDVGTCYSAIIRDITERKEAELQNTRLRRGLEASGVGTWAVDIEAGTAEWDDCSLAIYGLERDEFAADLGAWENALHPDDREKTLKHLAELNDEGAKAYNIEYRIVRPSGEVRDVLAEGTFERDNRGNLLFHSGTHRDITERKKAEAEIKRSQEFLQNLLDTSPVPIYITSKKDGRFLMANQAAAELNRLTQEELLKRSSSERYFDPKQRKEFVRQLEKTGRVDGVDLRARRIGTGEECWLSFNSRAIDYKGEEAILSVTPDITERKKAEEKIRQSEQRISSIFKSAVDGIVMMSDRGIIWEFSPGAEAMFQREAGEVIGQNVKILMGDDDSDRHDSFLENFRKGGLKSTIIGTTREITARRKDGTFFPIQISVTMSVVGGRTDFTGIIRDITVQKEAAEEIREARDVAEEATRAKDMFLAAMSHEIRTPMNGVVGMIELLQDTPLTDDQRLMLGTAKDSSFALLTIINDILDFSKIEAGKMKIESFAFDLRKAADSVGEMLGSVMAAEKRLPLIVHVQPEVPPLVLGDQVRIRQILLNLAGNAVKFTDDGEVHVRISVAKTHRDGSVDMVYEIKDSGIGMTEEQVGRLFKPFEQAEASTTRQYGGTGLGLSIVARLVELMGGKIEVDSKPGEGSTFRIMLHHGIPKVKAKEADGAELGRIKMLVLSKAGSCTDLLAQLLEANDNGQIDIVAPSIKKAALLKKLATAEKDGAPYALVYLSAEVGTGQQDQLRLAIENGNGLQKTPRFVVERHNTPITQDIPGSVLIPVTPCTETNLVRALSIVLGMASPDIVKRAEDEGRVIEVPTIEEAEAAGTLILVAEDNKTNQDVIGRQLAFFGYAHEIADDGEIALEMLSKRAYGLLLSDVHMPNMDGYQLTKAIRKKEEKSGAHLPIVAVTANALQGEGDRCLDAGMDGYMTKPVRMKELRICLGRWLSEAEEERATGLHRESGEMAATSPAEKSGSSVVELDMLIEMFGDDEEMISIILSDFPPAGWEGIDEIESAFKAKNWAAVGDTGHKLKSAARTIGANQLADIFEGLEEAGQTGEEETIEKLMAKLRPAMEAVEAYVRERI